MPLRPGNGFAGEVSEYTYREGLDRVIGWAAVYATETGRIRVYRSYETADVNELPNTDLQGYLVFYWRHNKVYTIWIDGHDEYALIGKRNRVTGLELSHDRFYVEVKAVMRAEWENRHSYGH